MTSTHLCFTCATDLAALIRRRKVSPLDVTRAILERIERENPQLNAYCTVAADLAAARRATAALTRRSARLGSLHGVPVAIKDLTPTKGIRTTWGSKIFQDHVPDEDGLIVQRLKGAARSSSARPTRRSSARAPRPSTPCSARPAIRGTRR